MNDSNQRRALDEICPFCGTPLGDEELYYGEIEDGIEGYAHTRCA